MSWSFSVNEQNRADALRVFGERINECVDLFKHMPAEIGERLKNTARVLSENAPEDAAVMISTNGHANDGNGHWWGSVNVNFCALKPKQEEADEDLRDHDPKPGDPEYAEAQAEERVIDGGSPSQLDAELAHVEQGAEGVDEQP